MSDPLIRECENFVVLEPGKEEKILSSDETLTWIEGWLEALDAFPKDLSNHKDTQSAAKRLLDTACDLQIKPGFIIQWFAVRVNPEEK